MDEGFFFMGIRSHTATDAKVILFDQSEAGNIQR